ncbi:MAG: beta-ketoacyl-[acyl-carrier-protein] synthase family protein [Planctomycetes bacterium]|nr:beta-ketoacyl-[acyl-carrier-protein] synthase family protein [Planctomycetota bacterium]
MSADGPAGADGVPPVDWARIDPAARPDTQRVVVTGMGMVSSLGPDVETTFERAARAESGIRRLTRFDPTGLPCDIGGEIDHDALDPDEPEDAVGGSAWHLLRTAARQAGAYHLAQPITDRRRVAVVMGGHGCTPLRRNYLHAAHYVDEQGDTHLEALARDMRYDRHQGLRRSPDTAPLLLARQIDARGPVLPIVSACAAGTQAIGEGLRLIRDDRADLVVVGGAEPLLYYTYVVGFALLGALTRRYASPETASRPFDRKRSGFVIAEGAGVLVLERLDGAKARGREVLGEVLGYGDSADAFRITDPHPQGRGAFAAIRGAMRDAAVHAEDIGYVNAHGTSTAMNDPIESAALERALGEVAATVPVSSNKSMLGHAIGAAGAIEAILTFEGMRRGVVLPTRNLDAPDRKCRLDYVPHEARNHEHAIALSNSFGFGGQNGCLCLGRGS